MGWQDDPIIEGATSAPQPKLTAKWQNDPVIGGPAAPPPVVVPAPTVTTTDTATTPPPIPKTEAPPSAPAPTPEVVYPRTPVAASYQANEPIANMAGQGRAAVSQPANTVKELNDMLSRGETPANLSDWQKAGIVGENRMGPVERPIAQVVNAITSAAPRVLAWAAEEDASGIDAGAKEYKSTPWMKPIAAEDRGIHGDADLLPPELRDAAIKQQQEDAKANAEGEMAARINEELRKKAVGAFEVPVPEAKTTGEKASDIVTGLGISVGEFAALQAASPLSGGGKYWQLANNVATWGAQNRLNGGSFGEGAAQGAIVEGISAIPLPFGSGRWAKIARAVTRAGKAGAEAGVFYGVSLANGAAWDGAEAIVQAALPVAVHGIRGAREYYAERLMAAKSGTEVRDTVQEMKLATPDGVANRVKELDNTTRTRDEQPSVAARPSSPAAETPATPPPATPPAVAAAPAQAAAPAPHVDILKDALHEAKTPAAAANIAKAIAQETPKAETPAQKVDDEPVAIVPAAEKPAEKPAAEPVAQPKEQAVSPKPPVSSVGETPLSSEPPLSGAGKQAEAGNITADSLRAKPYAELVTLAKEQGVKHQGGKAKIIEAMLAKQSAQRDTSVPPVQTDLTPPVETRKESASIGTQEQAVAPSPAAKVSESETISGKAKQPWERTQKEHVAVATAMLRPKDTTDSEWVNGYQGNARIDHSNKVRAAIDAGKPVPRAVLADYAGKPWADAALAKLDQGTSAQVQSNRQEPTREPQAAKEIEKGQGVARKPDAGLLSTDAGVKRASDLFEKIAKAQEAESGVENPGHYVSAAEREKTKAQTDKIIADAFADRRLDGYSAEDQAMLREMESRGIVSFSDRNGVRVVNTGGPGVDRTPAFDFMPLFSDVVPMGHGQELDHIKERAGLPVDFDLNPKKFNKIPQINKKAVELLKKFVKETPEVGIDPAFVIEEKTVTGDKYGTTKTAKRLVFRDGKKFSFDPEMFGLKSDDLKAGQRIGIPLEQLGEKPANLIKRAEKNAIETPAKPSTAKVEKEEVRRKGPTPPAVAENAPANAREAMDIVSPMRVAGSKSHYAISEYGIDGDNVIVTDGHRLFVLPAKGAAKSFGIKPKEGTVVIDNNGKRAEGNFPKYTDVIPRSEPIATIDPAQAWRDIRKAALTTSEESKGVGIVLNRDGSLGFVSHAPERGESSINVQDDHLALGAVNPSLWLDVLEAHLKSGSPTVKLSWKAHDRPIKTEGKNGDIGVMMPVDYGTSGGSKFSRESVEKWKSPSNPSLSAKAKAEREELAAPAKAKADTVYAEGKKKPVVAGGFIALPGTPGIVDNIRADQISSEPAINVIGRTRDIGPIQQWVGTLANQAEKSGSGLIKNAAKKLVEVPMVMQNELSASLTRDSHVFRQLPKDYRANNGEKFFALMDQKWTPADIDAAQNIPSDVKPALKHFKQVDEDMRLDIVRQKRDMATAMYMSMDKEALAAKAKESGIDLPEKWTKKTVADELAQRDVPQTWGRPWAHIYHAFMGDYELTWKDADGNKHFIGRAQTPAEAFEKLDVFRKAHADVPIDSLWAEPNRIVPLDVVRLSRGRYEVLKSQLKEAADLENQEIRDALRGVVGKRESKQKWAGILQQRKGAKGYETDFLRVWGIEMQQYHRWKYLTELNHEVAPLIEKIAHDRPGWAKHLQYWMDHLWGKERSVWSRGLDQVLERTPILKYYTKPFALERAVALAKSINYWRHLQTARFYVVNSLQPFQTLYPVLGERGMFNAFKMFYSKEGQDILRKYHIGGVSAKLHEVGATDRRWEKFTPAGASEARNQGLAFVGMYDYAMNKLGMSESEAASYARLRGQVMTQFAYSPADQPRIMAGPIGGLAFQYKRFTVKQLELVSRMLREGNYTGVGRWLAVNLLVGGAKQYVRAAKLGLAVAAAAGIGQAMGHDPTEDAHKALVKLFGKEIADVLVYGFPAMLGIDISGSVNLVDVPQGDTPQEIAGNLLLGPTGQSIQQIVQKAGESNTAKDIPWYKKAGRATMDTSPSLQQFENLYRAISRDTSNLDAKGRERYKLEITDLWKKALGFRTMSETTQRRQIDAMMALKTAYDSMLDNAANAINSGDEAAARKTIDHWNAAWPEAQIGIDAAYSRAKRRKEDASQTSAERQYDMLPKSLRGSFQDTNSTNESNARPGRPVPQSGGVHHKPMRQN